MIYISKAEIEAVRNAWEQVNANLESCFDETMINEMRLILTHLSSIDVKYKKNLKKKSYDIR